MTSGRNFIGKSMAGLAALVLGGVLLGDASNAEAKVTKVYRRANDTIIKIYDDEDPERYLYPVRLCDKCDKYHPDPNRRIVGLAFQAPSGRIVDYPPQL